MGVLLLLLFSDAGRNAGSFWRLPREDADLGSPVNLLPSLAGQAVQVCSEPASPGALVPGGAAEIVTDVNNSAAHSEHCLCLISPELPPTVSRPGPGPQIPGG